MTGFGWVEPGFLQGFLVSMGMLAVGIVSFASILFFAVGKKTVAAVVTIFLVGGAAYLYLAIAQAYAIYLMGSAGVHGWEWLLFALYVSSLFNGVLGAGRSQRS